MKKDNDFPENRQNSLGALFTSRPQLPTTAIALLLGTSLATAVILLPKAFNTAPGTVSALSSPPSSQKIKPLLASVYPESVQSYLSIKTALSDEDIERARIAWKYYENNYQKKTGLINAADAYPSTTMWDTGTSIAATIAAYDIGLIPEKEFDDRIVKMLASLYELKMYNNIMPNKVYNTETAEMVDYDNQASEHGLGASILDIGRLASWLNILAFTHPKHASLANDVLSRWNYSDLIKDGQMYGLYQDPVTNKTQVLQEGRLGYEQYAGKVFKMLGFDQTISANYNNQYKSTVMINDVPIVYDNRDPRKLGAFNYVVTESYVLDVFENGFDAVNKPLTDNIFEVQKRRWQKTGQVTAVSEDNVDRKPNFVYNTIYAAGSAWNTITDTGKDMNELKSISTKAAFSLAYLYPDDPYSKELVNTISSAYDPDKGWYSGIYEKGLGYNDVITSNTNGVILATLLYKKYGPLNQLSVQYKKNIHLKPNTYTETSLSNRVL